MTSSNRVLFLSPAGFSRLKQRHQSFAIELAVRGFDVVFVDPLFSNGYSVTSTQVQPGLRVLKVRVPFKAASFNRLQNICAGLAASLILRHADLVPESTVLWVAEPSLAAFTRLHWRSVIYDRCDLHGSFPGQRRHAWHEYEKVLQSRADLISVSHPYLASEFSAGAAAKTVLAANACSDEFICSIDQVARRPENGPVRIVSSGAHYEWVDCDWLRMLSEIEGAELHIAGVGRGRSFNSLITGSKVVFHGHLDHDGLLKLLQSCHVGVIPFRNLELIKGVDPIKAYEYAACGLEIWAPDLVSLHPNRFISRFVADKQQGDAALRAFRSVPAVFSGRVPVWSERLQTVLDRLSFLRSD